MSRNTTSAPPVSSLASTSAPSRHSPATTNSGKPVSNWRTPRRAAGSSSAMSTFHSVRLAAGKVGLHRQLIVGHAEYRPRAAASRRGNFKGSAIAVQHPEPLTRVLDAVSLGGNDGLCDARTVVNDRQLERLAIATSRDDDLSCAGAPG